MLRRFLFILCLGLLFSLPARADWFSGSSADLQNALNAPKITVDAYELATDELQTFYSARSYRPAWDFGGEDKDKTFAAFLDSISKVIDYHGLEKQDYPLEELQKLNGSTDNDSKIRLELLVTDTLIRLAHDMHGDMLDLADLYPGWNFKRDEIDIPATLAAAVNANSLNDYIEGLAPKNPAYSKLAQALQIYRNFEANGGWHPIDPGPSLKPKDHGIRVEQLRARLAAEGYLPQKDEPEKEKRTFDSTLQEAVADYQTRNGLASDGAAGIKTLEALNVPIAVRIDQIRANMERWRHMPDGFPPERYTLVNIPDASVKITEDGKEIYQGIVIIGKVDRKTPFIQSNIHSMIINPSWHVPTKIARKDILPKLRQDPHYLEKLGFVIKGNRDDPHGENIDWQSMDEQEFNFHLRQEPGDQNSLGRLKFDFDNDFAVYMHGTPHQELFKKNERSLSSGCVRLHDPEQVALIFLAHNKEAWDTEKIEERIATEKTHLVGLNDPMPLDIVYWSVFADDEGRINFRKDIYDYDRFLIENMKGEGTGKKLRLDQAPEKH